MVGVAGWQWRIARRVAWHLKYDSGGNVCSAVSSLVTITPAPSSLVPPMVEPSVSFELTGQWVDGLKARLSRR